MQLTPDEAATPAAIPAEHAAPAAALGWMDAGILVGVIVLAVAATLVAYAVAMRIVRRTGGKIDDFVILRTRRPALVIVPALALLFALPLAPLPGRVFAGVRHGISLVLIGAVAWVIIALINVLGDVAQARFPIDVADNLKARRVQTQFRVLRRVAVIVIGTVTVSIMLMTFPSIRTLGASLFASAGVAGLIIGLAARPAITNLLAGVQLAFTQPIRIDDVLVLEGEWGRVEEIGSTYVVLRIWDNRRLILPLSYFIETPFQNWTRVSADLLGTTFIYTDYTVPVEEVRRELKRILDASGMWDGKAWGLQVTDTNERAVTLRALMSAPDSGRAWDLRCHVREKLIEFLQREYPGSLPRTRAEVERKAVGTDEAADRDGGRPGGAEAAGE